MNKALDGYLTHLRDMNYSKNTIRQFTYCLRLFVSYLEEGDPGVNPGNLTRDMILTYARYVFRKRPKEGRNLSIHSRRAILKCASIFLKYLEKEGIVKNGLSHILAQKKWSRRLPRDVLTKEEVTKLIASCPDTSYGRRDRAMLEVLYATGMRRTELINLEIGDYQRDSSQIFIRQGKGKKDRILPLPTYLPAILDEYLMNVRPRLSQKRPGENALFVAGGGSKYKEAGLNSWSLRVKMASGLPFTPHKIRHAYARHLLMGGASLVHIKSLLGHEQISSTYIYTRILPMELMNRMKEKHPRNIDGSSDKAVILPGKNWKLAPLPDHWKSYRRKGKNPTGLHLENDPS